MIDQTLNPTVTALEAEVASAKLRLGAFAETVDAIRSRLGLSIPLSHEQKANALLTALLDDHARARDLVALWQLQKEWHAHAMAIEKAIHQRHGKLRQAIDEAVSRLAAAREFFTLSEALRQRSFAPTREELNSMESLRRRFGGDEAVFASFKAEVLSKPAPVV